MINDTPNTDVQNIDGELFIKMFLSGTASLEAKKEWINELNVFPVPDGDTGTNMCMTIESAVRELDSLTVRDMDHIAKAISSGSLKGARGNSGVILSQLLRGFTNTIKRYDTLDKIVICEAAQKAVETAYKAVMRPKEGTILTVAKGAAGKALELACDDSCNLNGFLAAVIQEAEDVLETTPDLLPVLKQAGVVDSGGQGLVEILKGAYDAFLGKEVDYTAWNGEKERDIVKISKQAREDIKFGYCTEYIIVLDRPLTQEEEDDYRVFLESMGDSVVLVADEDIVKTHVHTNDPGEVLHRAVSYGSLSRIKIDNMREEHQEKLIKDAEKVAAAQLREREEKKKAKAEPRKGMGFVAVSVGEGLNEVFKGLGADYIIEGGQTMNPSTEDVLKAVSKVNADTVFILPNNKNIILAANQAAALEKDKNIIVVPTKTIPQGITALINFVPEQTPEENRDTMTEVIATVKTGQVTYAIRDTVIDEQEIRQGDFMGIGDKTILSSGTDRIETARKMVDGMMDEESSFICIYYGEEVEEGEAGELENAISMDHPECEVELQNGGQPVYYYVISVE